MIIVDTSALLAYFRADDPYQRQVAQVIEGDPVRVVSPYAVAELDYLVRSRFGDRAEAAVLAMLGSGNFELPHMGPVDLLTCQRIVEHYCDLGIGVADASVVVLADRYGTDRVCTLDHRDFGVLRCLDGRPFTILTCGPRNRG